MEFNTLYDEEYSVWYVFVKIKSEDVFLKCCDTRKEALDFIEEFISELKK